MTVSGLRATQLILGALVPDQTPQAWQSDFEQSGVAWDDLTIRAIVFGLAPQLHQRFVDWELDVPQHASAKLRVTYQAHAKRNAAIFTQLGEVLAACTQHNLHPIALKGIHLATKFYSEPALRPMNDIDLLFRPAELPAAETMLESLGYTGKRKSSGLGPGITKHTSTFRRPTDVARTPNPYLSADADRTVEPHTSLEESWFGLQVDITPGVRQRAFESDLAGHRCLVLSHEDLLLHLCVHFCFHLIMGTPAMVQLTDLLVAAQARKVNWSDFVQHAVDRRAAPYALASLSLARRLAGAPVPEPVLTDLEHATPARLRRRIDSLDLAYVLRRTQQKPLTTISQRLERGIRDRAEAARWALNWRDWWRVWRTVLQISRTDTGRMLLERLHIGA